MARTGCEQAADRQGDSYISPNFFFGGGGGGQGVLINCRIFLINNYHF